MVMDQTSVELKVDVSSTFIEYIYIYKQIYMLTIADQTARPTELVEFFFRKLKVTNI